MELVLVEATQLTELIQTVRELKDTVKELLASKPEPVKVQEEYISRTEAMKFLHVQSPATWVLICKRYDFKMRKVGIKKLFLRSHLEQVLAENNYRLDLSPLTEAEIEAALHRNL